MARVLIAEDSLMTARVLQRYLERAGFDASVAYDGSHAWQLLSRQPVDALLMDYAMPGMDGEQLCSRVRLDERLRDLPIVLVTGRGYEINVEALREKYSLAAVFIKPFSLKELLDATKRAVNAPAVH